MFRYFFHRFKTHFELDRRQAKIHFVLLWVTMLVLCSPVFTYYAFPLLIPQEPYHVSIDTLCIDQDSLALPTYPESQEAFKKHIGDFSEQDWLKVGLPSYLAKRIMKYQAKGAVLHSSQDLLKVYGMNNNLLQKVKPFLLEGKAVPEKIVFTKKKETKPIQPIDINRVDTTSLMALPGIGPVFARRIIQYRTLLKGYVHTSQFKEIYGLTEFALETLESNTFVSLNPLCSLQVCDYRKLNEHLYLSAKDARYITGQLKNNSMCWDDLKSGLEPKAQEHLELLKLYYPCE